MAEPTGAPVPPGPETPGDSVAASPKVERPKLIDAVIDLLVTVRDWIRQELGDAVHDKVAVPMQRVGMAIGSALAAGCLLAFGLMLVVIGLLILLAHAITWPGVLLLFGALLIIGSAIFLVIKVRVMVR